MPARLPHRLSQAVFRPTRRHCCHRSRRAGRRADRRRGHRRRARLRSRRLALLFRSVPSRLRGIERDSQRSRRLRSRLHKCLPRSRRGSTSSSQRRPRSTRLRTNARSSGSLPPGSTFGNSTYRWHPAAAGYLGSAVDADEQFVALIDEPGTRGQNARWRRVRLPRGWDRSRGHGSTRRGAPGVGAGP